MKKRIISLITATMMILTVMAAPMPVMADTNEATPYAVEGGNIYIDEEGTITDCDDMVTKAVIPPVINSITVKTIGGNAFKDCTSLETVRISYGVTGIENYAFGNCQSLDSIYIPESVTSIGNWAFHDCPSLTTIYCEKESGASEYAEERGYYWEIRTAHPVTGGNIYVDENGVIVECDRTITEAEIPASVGGYTVYEIDNYAFANCTALTRVRMSSSVLRIEQNAFENCTSLIEVRIPKNVGYISSDAFKNCPKLTIYGWDNTPAKTYASDANIPFMTVYTVDNGNVYYDKTGTLVACDEGVKSVTLPEQVTRIGESAFSGCKSLTTVTMQNTVTSIAINAFSDCDLLNSLTVEENNPYYTTVNGVLFNADKTELIYYPKNKNRYTYTVPANVTSIGDFAFNGCNNLKEITLPYTLSDIAPNAFLNCSNLAVIVVEEQNLYYTAEDGVLFNYDKTELIFYPNGKSETSYDISDSVTSIGASAFSGCANIETIAIPVGVTEIAENAFFNCISLSSISVQKENMHYADADGILFDKAMTKLIQYPVNKGQTDYLVPNGVNTIGTYAFSKCPDLQSIIIPYGVKVIENYAFLQCSGLRNIVIPDSIKTIGTDAFSECDDNLRMCGHAGSVAQVYANSNGISFTIVSKSSQTIAGAESFSKTLGDGSFSLGASAKTPLSYVSSNPGIATVSSGGVVTIRSTGTVRITITAAETEQYSGAEKTVSIVIAAPKTKAVQTISVNDSFSKTFGSKPFNLGASANTALTYTSSDKNIATVSTNGTVTLKNPGKATITIAAAETEQYKGASKSVTLNVKLKKPTLKLKIVKTEKGRKLKLSWNKVPGATKYQVYMYDFKTKKYKRVITKKADKRFALHSKMKSGTYKYKVRAYRVVNGKKVYGPFSKEKKKSVVRL